jgi:hypothetical protein
MHLKAGHSTEPVQLRSRNDGARGDEPYSAATMYGLCNFDQVFSNNDWLEYDPRSMENIHYHTDPFSPLPCAEST